MTKDDKLKKMADLNNKEYIYTPFDMKVFAFNESHPTAWNLCKWLESKTFDKYTVVRTEYIKALIAEVDELKKQLFLKEAGEVLENLMPLITPDVRKNRMLNHFRSNEVF